MPEKAVTIFSSTVDSVRHALDNIREEDCLVLLALAWRQELPAVVRDFVAAD